MGIGLVIPFSSRSPTTSTCRVLFVTRQHLVGIDVDDAELDEITEATAITVGSVS
jgi:hypothetical protein